VVHSALYFFELLLAAANRGGYVSGLLWRVEPHGIPIGEQWGGQDAGLPHLLVAMIGSSGRGAPEPPVECEPGPAAVQVTRCPTACSKKPIGKRISAVV
jgi:hypothetical protein